MMLPVNRVDMRFSLLVSLVVSLPMGGVCFFIKDVRDSCNVASDTLSVFSLTFLGFILTSFTVFQVLQSKTWFEKIKTTNAFSELLNAFKLLIIVSACGIFVALFLRISVSLFTHKYFLIAGVWLSVFIIAFLCAFAWKTISAIIEFFKV